MLKLFPFLLLLPHWLLSQNLVLNPGFEQLQPNAVVVACQFMQYSSNFPAATQEWTSFPGLTPDVLRGAENCPTLPQTHGGDYCVGLIHYMPGFDIGRQSGDYHEMIQGRLLRPLKPGVRYRLALWVREDSTLMRQHLAQVYGPEVPCLPVRAGNLGFCFLVESLDTRSEFPWQAKRRDLRPQVNFTEVIATNGQWVQLSATFVADQPAQYFVIGNFSNDRITPIDLSKEQRLEIEQKNAAVKNPTNRIKRVGYVCLDDISIVPEVESAPVKTGDLETQLLTERKYTFSAGVLFDSGEATLRPEAQPELDKLADFLQKHPKTRLGIAGHTDDVGTDSDNLALSQQRAQAVYDFLLNKEVPATRIQWKGFGEVRPVADNGTETGRQQNRRVECVVL